MELKKITDTAGIEFSTLMEIVDQIRGPVNVGNVVDVSTKLMGLVGKVKGLDGHKKKFVVVQLLMYFVKNTGSGKIDDLMDPILLNVIPTVIDKLVEVERGQLVFNANVKEKVTPHAKSLWAKIKAKLAQIDCSCCSRPPAKEIKINVNHTNVPVRAAIDGPVLV